MHFLLQYFSFQGYVIYNKDIINSSLKESITMHIGLLSATESRKVIPMIIKQADYPTQCGSFKDITTGSLLSLRAQHFFPFFGWRRKNDHCSLNRKASSMPVAEPRNVSQWALESNRVRSHRAFVFSVVIISLQMNSLLPMSLLPFKTQFTIYIQESMKPLKADSGLVSNSSTDCILHTPSVCTCTGLNLSMT